MVEVVATDEFAEWWEDLDGSEAADVARVVDLLELQGTELGFPYSSALKDTGFAIRELRIQSKGRPFRVFYAFDPWRQAVLLIGGDKTGEDRFYETFIPKAERIWEQYLAEEKARRG